MTPQRIQLRRTAGWRIPVGAVSVARPTRWGNPFLVRTLPRDLHLPGTYGVFDSGRPDAPPLTLTRDRRAAHRFAVEQFVLHTGPLGLYEPDDPKEWLAPLHGRDLACWCPPDLPCHADALIDWCLTIL